MIVNIHPPVHTITNKMIFVTHKDSDQPGTQLSRTNFIFILRLMESKGLMVPSRVYVKDWSDWVDAQADLSVY